MFDSLSLINHKVVSPLSSIGSGASGNRIFAGSLFLMSLFTPLSGFGEEVEDFDLPEVEVDSKELETEESLVPDSAENSLLPAVEDPLPLEPLRDPFLEEGLLPGWDDEPRPEADAFDDLEGVEGPEISTSSWGSAGGNWTGARFDSGIRGRELLSSGFADPLQREGFRFGLGISAIYDSNVRLLESDEVDDISFTLSPTFEYRSGPPEGVPGIVTLSYQPIIRKYLDDSDLDTIDHSASSAVSFTGTRGKFNAEANYGLFAASNVVVGGVADNESFSMIVSGSYLVSDRITLFSEFSHRYRSTQGAGASEVSNDVSTIEIGGSWAARSNLSIGPTLRYSETSADTAESSESLSYLATVHYSPLSIPTLELGMSAGIETVDRGGEDSSGFTGDIDVTYQRDERFSLIGRLAYQEVSAATLGSFGDTGGGGDRLTGGLVVNYVPNELWRTTGSITMVSVPSPTTNGQTASPLQFNIDLIRSLGVGSVSLGGEWATIDYEGAPPREDDTLITGSLRYQRPVFGDSASFNTSVQWSENSGLKEWSRLQMMTGLNFEF